MTENTQVSLTPSPWDIDSLLRNAYERVKPRFLKFFLAYILSSLAVTGVVGAFGVVGVLAGYTTYAPHNLIMFITLVGTIAISGFFVLVYVSSWMQLTLLKIITQEDPKTSLMETFKSVQPLIKDYFVMQLIITAFMIGLVPVFFLTFGIAGIFWWVIFTFVQFVFIDKQKKGLDNLWLSKELVQQNFFGVFGRIAFILVTISFLSGIFRAMENPILKIIGILIEFLSTPFTLSFYYEMYRNFKHPAEEVEKPKVWLGISVVGWIITFLLTMLFIGIMAAYSMNPSNLNDDTNRRDRNNNMFNDEDLTPPPSLDYGTRDY
jgi:hypothetical protein